MVRFKINFVSGYLFSPELFITNTFISPLTSLDTLVGGSYDYICKDLFLGLYAISLVYMCAFMPISHISLPHVVVTFDIRMCESYSFSLFSRLF